MKLNKIFIAAVCALAACGCSFEEFGGIPDGVTAPKIRAELDEPLTRTCMGDANAQVGEKVPMMWTPGDSIGVFSTGSKNVCYTNDEKKENVINTSFSTLDYVSGNIQYAYYPYSAENEGKSTEALSGSIPQRQIMGETIVGDYKYGRLREGGSDGEYTFKFHNMFSLVRFSVDATGTEYAGKTLDGVKLTVISGDGVTAVPITGEFSFSAVDGTYDLGTASNTLMTVWKNQKLDGTLVNYASLFPTIKKGDKLTFALGIEDKIVSFTVESGVDFASATFYNFPLKLKNYNCTVTTRPTLSGFKFVVANNKGKLLDNKTVWESKKPKFTGVSEHTVDFNGGNSANLMIPYLFDYKLVPTFNAGSNIVTVDGKKVTSGVTEVDFTNPVTFTVSSGNDWRDYEVSLENTGLPVVVLKQSDSGDFSKVTTGSIFNRKTVNQFVDFMIRGKDTKWVKDDVITVYEPDGTVNMTSTCGARLRGNTSQEYPKKPFAVKLTEYKEVLGMEAHDRWVLLANWLDHSMIRNTVAFDIAHAMEEAWRNNNAVIDPGIPWNVHGQNVELVFVESDGTGHHVGNYYLCEQIKIDANRLNINSPYKEGENTDYKTCGYLLELDTNYDEDSKFITSKYSVPFMFKDAVSDEILNNVKTKVQRIEDNIYNKNYSSAYAELDINSVIDQWLIWELTMNHEFLDPRSVYYFMNGDGPLSAGPVWDFDRATFQNYEKAQTMGSSGDRLKPYNEWICLDAKWKAGLSESKLEDYYPGVWYPQLLNDSGYKAAVKARWNVMYDFLERVLDKIDSYKSMSTSFEVDSAMWPTSKADIQAYKSSFSDWSGDETISVYYNGENGVIDNFKTVYRKRLDRMNNLINAF